MKAALLNRDGKVIGEVFGAPEKGNSIDVAGSFTINSDPVNVRTYKISRSRANLQKAAMEQPLSKVGDVWTFFNVVNGEVVY